MPASRSDPTNLDSVEGTLDPQHRGQHDHGIAVRHQEISRRDVTVRDERFDSAFTGADEQRQFASLTKIVGWNNRLAIKQNPLSSPTSHQLNTVSVHLAEHIGDGTTILARLRHLQSKCLTHVGCVATTLSECLDIPLAPDAALIAGTGSHARAAQRMAKQPRACLAIRWAAAA